VKELIARLQASFSTLSQRERRLVVVAAAGITAFTLFMVVHTFSTKADSLRSMITQKSRDLDEIQALALGFRETEAKRLAVETQLKQSNIRLITYLEEKATKTGIELPSINPKADVPLEGDLIVESAVELALTDVKLNRLLDFLTAVEAAPGGLVKVKYMRLEPRPAQETLSAWLTIATYHSK
jgi:general secretion pathway protein M